MAFFESIIIRKHSENTMQAQIAGAEIKIKSLRKEIEKKLSPEEEAAKKALIQKVTKESIARNFARINISGK